MYNNKRALSNRTAPFFKPSRREFRRLEAAE